MSRIVRSVWIETMSDNTVFLIFVIVTALLGSIILLFISAKVIKFILLRKLPENKDSFYERLRQVQEIVDNANQRLSNEMIPYGKYRELEQAEIDTTVGISALKEESERLKQEIKVLNKDALDKERKKDELKKNSSNTLLLIGELIANRTTLDDEMVVLKGNLEASKSELKTLVDEIEMAEEQKAVFAELSSTMDEVKERLFEVSSTYKDSAKNLMELENQYQSLEKEYKKLIELNLKKEAAARE